MPRTKKHPASSCRGGSAYFSRKERRNRQISNGEMLANTRRYLSRIRFYCRHGHKLQKNTFSTRCRGVSLEDRARFTSKVLSIRDDLHSGGTSRRVEGARRKKSLNQSPTSPPPPSLSLRAGSVLFRVTRRENVDTVRSRRYHRAAIATATPLSLAFHRVSRHACMFARKNIGRWACEKRRRERRRRGKLRGPDPEGITCLFSRDSKQRAREKFKGGSPETFAPRPRA